MIKTKEDGIERTEKTPSPVASALERRILIIAPTGNDAALTAEFLKNARLDAVICGKILELADQVKMGCGALVLAEEILSENSISILVKVLEEQPVWSDIPVVLITSGGEASQAQLRRLTAFGPGGNVTLLERPFRPMTLLSVIEVALRSRQRQYEARESVRQLKNAHDEIQSASRAKDDFLAALSHELRTPLNPVLLVAGENANNPSLAPSVRKDFEMIRKNIELEARLIDDLLDLTKISNRKLSLNKQFCSVQSILRDALATIKNDIQQKKLTLHAELNEEQDIVLGDSARLQQVFWNILKNAVKFTDAGGRITVHARAFPDKSLIVVKIADTGIGMSPRDIAKVFNAFSQGSHAQGGNSHRFGGLGLGLAIAHSLIKMHLGRISATSDGLGKGSTFTVELPIEAAKRKADLAADLPAKEPQDSSAEKIKNSTAILLVEDHEPTRMALSNLLVRRKYTVLSAGSIAEALKLVAQEKFDLVISDIGLPDGNGYELMRTLKDAHGLQGIALTGYGMEHDILKSRQAGFFTHLTKPIRIESLEKALSEVEKLNALQVPSLSS